MNDVTMDLVNQIVKLAHREHVECEDPWYSCPKSPEGCLADNGDECDCGADRINDQVKELYNKINAEGK